MAKDYQYLFSQLRRIEDHREEKAEKEIRKIYKQILKDTKQFIAEEYYQLAEDGKLTYEILRSKGQDVRFLAEIEQRLGDVSLKVSDEIKQAVNELYQMAYDGMKDAVQNGKDTAAFFEGVDTTTAQTMRSAVDNPIMEIALEKNHKDITWGIKREVATALTVGDRFETLAHRIADNLDRSYRKGILIARTEMHRVREAGHYESAKDMDETLKQGSSGMRMVKVWKTMKDGVVRPNRRYKTKKGWKTAKPSPGAPDHVKMHGQTVLADEKFDLGGGVEAIAPGQSGVAGHDCNCRCTVLYKLMDDEQFFQASGRHFRGQSAGDGSNADYGEAILEKTIDFDDKKAVMNEIDRAQSDFAQLNHEENLTITADGKVWRVKGEKNTVNPWVILDAGSSLEGSYSYHNHPASETNYSFSAEDTSFFFASKQAYSKAADDLFEYAMARTSKTVDVDPEAIYNKFGELYKTEVWELAWDGEIDIDQDGYHEVMKRLSKEYGFAYKRERLNGD